MNLFDILGPVMVGPSSSHTAGAVRLGRTARRLLGEGTLPLGEKLPSVRELSTQLTINPNTIQRAYRELETDGYICSVAGRGSYVCAQIPDDPVRQDALLQQFDAAVQELLYLGMRSEELRRRIPEGGTNHD